MGLPATTEAANAASWVSRADLATLIAAAKQSPAFGGIVLWDSSYDQHSSDGTSTYGAYAAALLRN